MIHHRHYSMRLQQWNYSWSAAYFITICTKQRLPILGKIRDILCIPSSYGHIVYRVWFDLINHYDCYLDEFIVMPDHVHGIIFIKPSKLTCVRNVGAIHELPLRFDGIQNEVIHELPLRFDDIQNDAYRKNRRQMIIPKMIGRFKMQSGKMINELRDTPGQVVWQRDYYETIIKSQRQLDYIRQYIINNPWNWQGD